MPYSTRSRTSLKDSNSSPSNQNWNALRYFFSLSSTAIHLESVLHNSTTLFVRA